MESSVLGSALEGVDVEEEKEEKENDQFEKPPADEGEERDKLRDQVYDAMSEDQRKKEDAKTRNEESQKNGTTDSKLDSKCVEKIDETGDLKDKESDEKPDIKS